MVTIMKSKAGKIFCIFAFAGLMVGGVASLTDSHAKIMGDFSVFSGRVVKIDPALLSGSSEYDDFGKNLIDAAALDAFYRARHYEAYWMSNSAVYSAAERMIKSIEESWTHGLNPETYHYSDIYELLKNGDPKDKQKLDVLLSDAFIRYAGDLSGMRVSPQIFGMRDSDWKQKPSAPQALALLTSDKRNMDDILKGLEPAGQTYRILRKELMKLIAQDSSRRDEMLPINLSGVLRPGYGHDAVPALRDYFGLPAVQGNNWATYDDDLAAAVIAFQRENGLTADGVIGPGTMTVINHGKKAKIEQLILNMERLRWDDTSTRGNKYVVVNVPSAMLWAVEGGKVALEMPVVVGKPERATNIFKTDITGMRFNPDWTVPPTIKKLDILPKLQEDPEFYSVVGMRMIVGEGSSAYEIDPNTVDWNSISSKDLQSIRMVQTPGINNPLGYYRVIMPNPYNIYLHDTTRPELFADNYRALSSGCVRVQEPKKLAEFILETKVDWDGPRIDRALASKRKMDIMTEDTIPVSILYYTAWINASGHVVYGPDIYGYDKKLLSALQKIDGFAIPSHNETGASATNARPSRVNN